LQSSKFHHILNTWLASSTSGIRRGGAKVFWLILGPWVVELILHRALYSKQTLLWESDILNRLTECHSLPHTSCHRYFPKVYLQKYTLTTRIAWNSFCMASKAKS
jgi:hypothetical protein